MKHRDRPLASEFTWATAILLTAIVAFLSILAFSNNPSVSEILSQALKLGWLGGLGLLAVLVYVLARRRHAIHVDPVPCKMVVSLLGYILLIVAIAISTSQFYGATSLIPLALAALGGASLFVGTYLSAARPLLHVMGFTCLMLAAFSGFGNWPPQVQGGFPQPRLEPDVYSMSLLQLADQGETIIFGGIGQSKVQGAIGKGQCPLCHAFKKHAPGWLVDRAPNLWGITARKRLHKTSIEYIAESHVCPSCYVVGGFGVKGTDNRESPMPRIHKPPISLSLEELIAVDTWLFVNEGEMPPPPEVIRNAYLQLVRESEFRKPNQWPKPVAITANSNMSTEAIFRASRCIHCHVIPMIRGAVGKLGPTLSFPHDAPRRFEDENYTGHATTFREYLEEAILDHNVDIPSGYRQTLLPEDYFKRNLSAGAVHKLIDYLESAPGGDAKLAMH